MLLSRVLLPLSLGLVLGLSVVVASPTPLDIYTSTSSKLVKGNSKYVVHVTLEQTATKAHVFTACINSSETETNPAILYSSPPVTIQPGQSADLEVPTKELPSSSYNLTLQGYPEGSSQEDGFESSSVVYKQTKHQSLLLQTDKVIYKPGETVNFRVVMFCNKLRPLNNQLVNITISDPQRNIIKVLPNQEVNNGIFASSIQLSTEPNLGDWRIKAAGNEQTTYHTFSVDQYVLPKFKVEVNLPNFVTYNASKFTAEVKASYTYGKPITGELEVRLSEHSRYHWGQPPKVVLKTSPITGSAFVEFDIATELDQKPLTYEKQFQVVATVRDTLTGKQQNGTKIIKIHQFPYKIEMIESPRNYKPGFPLELKFKVTTQDDIPISDDNERALKIEHGFVCNAEDSVAYFRIPSNGIVNVTFITPTNELVSSYSLKVTYKDYTFTAHPPPRVTTPSKVYMDLTLATKSPEVDSKLDVKVFLNQKFEALNYLLIGRGKILDHGRHVVAPAQKEFTFQIEVPREAAPEAKVIVYTIVKDTNEVVAESVKFNLRPVFENNLTISLSKETGEPGESVKISLDTKADSIIALRGVDQSVLLLKEDKDITIKTIENEINSYQQQLNYNRNWGGSQSYQAFEESGIIIMTNGKLDMPIRYSYQPGPPQPFINSEGSYSGAQFDTAALRPAAGQVMKIHHTTLGSSASGPEVRIRTKFPETWLWEHLQANNSVSVLEKIIPDTITSWFVSGYALSPSSGIGISNAPVILKTFRPFFLSLNIPYSVVKGEIFGLQVLVHNYMNVQITADITVQNTGNGFEFQEESNKAAPQSTKSVTIGPNQVHSVTFVVKPIKFGTQSLDIKGITTNAGNAQAGDGISRPLLVKPPGQKQTITQSALVDLRSTASSRNILTVELPPNRVEGADSVKFSIISDLLGTTISNLDSLLKMPTGCGEQNLVYFVPDVVILQYLESSGTLTPQIRKKAVKFLESGYQRQLTYRHDDGSFSAFGKHDHHGSTWLTAFTLGSFVAARPYITIDEAILIDAIKFLSTKQQADGSFVEHGNVLQNELKGGAVESLSLSAYVTLALLKSSAIVDNAEALVNVTVVKDKALEYLSKSHTDGFDDPYAAAIVTYTLQVARHPKFQAFKQVLEKLAKREGGLQYWEPKPVETPAVVNASVKHPWVPRIKPVSVEMTSYALLVYLAEGNLDNVLPIGKWLIQQRSESGGFISTQDTVVGLTALAKFATATTSGPPALRVNVTYEGGVQTFHLNEQNQIVLHEATLPNTVRTVQVEAGGKGSALAQFICTYYVEDKTEAPAFSLTVKKREEGTKLNLDICTAYIQEKNKTSNMAVLQVNLPSGFTFDTDELQTLKSTVDGLKRYDLEEGDSQVHFYFDGFSARSTCLSVEANRVFKVANPAKAYVQVYDYYDTTLRAREFYDAPALSACDICIGEASCAVKNCV